jgi:NTP pyrophosphatase (non-canonical NTP hydrolase)
MTMSDDTQTTVSALRLAVQRFNDARDWHQFHTPKNVAASIAIEAAELLEQFQWVEDLPAERKAAVLEELADVVIYCLTLVNVLDADLTSVVMAKLAHNAAKYPVEAYRGRYS